MPYEFKRSIVLIGKLRVWCSIGCKQCFFFLCWLVDVWKFIFLMWWYCFVEGLHIQGGLCFCCLCLTVFVWNMKWVWKAICLTSVDPEIGLYPHGCGSWSCIIPSVWFWINNKVDNGKMWNLYSWIWGSWTLSLSHWSMNFQHDYLWHRHLRHCHHSKTDKTFIFNLFIE